MLQPGLHEVVDRLAELRLPENGHKFFEMSFPSFTAQFKRVGTGLRDTASCLPLAAGEGSRNLAFNLLVEY